MGLFTAEERRFAECIGTLAYCNPFVPERITTERAALGDAFIDTPRVWSLRADTGEADRANIDRLAERVEPLAEALRARLASGVVTTEADRILYEDVVLYMLYQRDRMELQQTIASTLQGRGTVPVRYWKRFKRNFDRFLQIPGTTLPTGHRAAHLFAVFFQIRRAFFHTFTAIVGGSMPAARLRAAVWQSIFTHDLRRYSRVLYKHMEDFTTLVTGPSGTGKELVARAIGQSRYIPFDDESERFVADFASSFHAVNLSALSPSLIESELFGHKRGAFTGAVVDRVGWLELCRPLGTVFMDEVGELDPTIQVKLLRVLQTRSFQRLGDTDDRRFHGKIIAATNKDLQQEMHAGRFRTDFYYRVCSDTIATPTLAEVLADDPDDLYNLALCITTRIVDDEAETLAEEVTAWIGDHLGSGYPWPGNFRELEQCVRNLLVRRVYRPPHAAFGAAGDPVGDLLAAVREGRLTAAELLRRYCTIVYARTGNYEQAAQRLRLDRRTVRDKIDRDLLDRLEIVVRPTRAGRTDPEPRS